MKTTETTNVIDLSEFVTQDNAENGVWFPFEIEGKSTGVEICVLGTDCESVAIYAKRAEKKMTKMLSGMFNPTKKNNNNEDDFNEADARTELAEKIESAVVRINGIRKIGGGTVIINGKEIEQNKQSYRYFCEKIRYAIDFVINKSGDRANFFSSKKSN